MGDLSGSTQQYYRIGPDLAGTNAQNFGLFDYDAVPNGTIIDLRTMTILRKHPGGGSDLESLKNELEAERW